jgi:hypothetical protein
MQGRGFGFVKMKIPKFSGEGHDYPEFKKMWKMVADQYDDAQQFHFLRNEALPFNLKTKVKICPDLKSAWLELEDEFGQADVIAMSGSVSQLSWRHRIR